MNSPENHSLKHSVSVHILVHVLVFPEACLSNQAIQCAMLSHDSYCCWNIRTDTNEEDEPELLDKCKALEMKRLFIINVLRATNLPTSSHPYS